MIPWRAVTSYYRTTVVPVKSRELCVGRLEASSRSRLISRTRPLGFGLLYYPVASSCTYDF